MGIGADSDNHLIRAAFLTQAFLFVERVGSLFHMLAVSLLAMAWISMQKAVGAVRRNSRPVDACCEMACRLCGENGIVARLLGRRKLSCDVHKYDVALRWLHGINYCPWQEPNIGSQVGSLGECRRSTFMAWAERWFGNDLTKSFTPRRLAVCRVHRDDVHIEGRRHRTTQY